MLLHAVENAQIAGYLYAIQQLEPGVVKQQVASILANDAQHVAVVRAALGQSAIPSAFVTGPGLIVEPMPTRREIVAGAFAVAGGAAGLAASGPADPALADTPPVSDARRCPRRSRSSG